MTKTKMLHWSTTMPEKLKLILLTICVIVNNINKISGSIIPHATENTLINTCPRECTCDSAPLRVAPFVLSWMKNWETDKLKDLHPNDVLDEGDVKISKTAQDADVDVNLIGKHVTCAIQPSTKVSSLFADIPQDTMVLTLLQSPGCNYTVLEGGQFLPLHKIKALHIQGYAYRDESQISGFVPLDDLKTQERLESQQMKHINLVLTEDALKTMHNLEILDLQFVRILAKKDARRLKRFSNLHPISRTTLLDLPIKDFIKLAHQFGNKYKHEPLAQKNLQVLELANNIDQYDEYDDYYDYYSDDISKEYSSEEQQKDILNEIERETNDIIDSLNQNINNDYLVPYEVYQAEAKPYLAPFRHLHKLRHLRVAHAKLDKIGQELLKGLKSLHTLTLEHNKVKIIPKEMFAITPSLRHISLAHNEILEVNGVSLIGLNNLLTLDLSYNLIPVIGSFMFPPLPSLTTLQLSGNPISNILTDSFININNTERLYIGHKEKPIDVSNDIFRGLDSLKVLVIENINIPILNKDFIPVAPQLEELRLHGNVSSIEFDTFLETPNLIHLDLSNSSIKSVSMDAFFNLGNLKILDLSQNKIEELEPGTFDPLSSITELYLHGNQLTTLPPSIFHPIPAKLIHVYDNPWDCSCDLMQLVPTTTNMIKRDGYLECKWNEKLATVCENTPDKFIYDTRVAPLCATPTRLIEQDVYHAAVRYLDCSNDEVVVKKSKNITINPVVAKRPVLFKEKQKKKKKLSNLYLPLSAYTPPTNKPIDLFELAKEDGLVEISPSDYQRVGITNNNKKRKFGILSDQPLSITKKSEIVTEISSNSIHGNRLSVDERTLKKQKYNEINADLLREKRKHKERILALLAKKEKKALEKKMFYKKKKFHP